MDCIIQIMRSLSSRGGLVVESLLHKKCHSTTVDRILVWCIYCSVEETLCNNSNCRLPGTFGGLKCLLLIKSREFTWSFYEGVLTELCLNITLLKQRNIDHKWWSKRWLPTKGGPHKKKTCRPFLIQKNFATCFMPWL